MTVKTKTLAGAAVSSAVGVLRAGPWSTPPWTQEERLRHIEAMGLRIDGYIRFMCQVATLHGASAEAKDKAVIAFYDKMVVVESQLRGIQETLRLE